ncbi:5-formyltetrahydrofolate cyclo-ligase [Arsenicicoccus dermatophilus]|uniref:5-formyltetrahydrofolate cyclo-ligase n=1 Tax=Arsenicicoccus dermatophilus TaxID=1076331 RepID=UPI001F4D2937|nr:5-formyltetrahydrofolate cyclo-ligase [Arsenicicoccus dermatophilus]MCH8612087.1 5-formyltetrahydrofolate cyclo-ligase [Arsenicicoccus dermatophilus]
MDGTSPGSKKALRTELWAARRARLADSTSARRDSDAARLAEQAMRLVREHVAQGATVTSYESYPAEPGTRPLNRALVAAGFRVIVPVTLPDLDLDWRPLDSAEDDESARLGRDAIGEADLLLIPGTAVDRTGVRLGQGGGCYDRALPRRRDGVPVITLLHPGELLAAPLPRNDHDQLVDAVVTACGVSWIRHR